MKIRIVDDLNPEDVAMLQALYSRSAHSVDDHLDTVRRAGSGRFMERYYVGYGHKSIADCGSTTLFVEGVSLLAAKAIQDWPLYSGQETSTRYIDMAKQPIVDPIGSEESKHILDSWMRFYVSKQERVAETIRSRYPRFADEKEDVYERAVKARTFDILRGFLPAGITTQLSWHTNLRQAGDHLSGLVHHPAAEIHAIARVMREQLALRYPSSGAGLSLPLVAGVGTKHEATHSMAQRMSWETAIGSEFAYSVEAISNDETIIDEMDIDTWGVEIPSRYEALLANRPRGCVLPHFMADFGIFKATFALDFGSFRDLQRHRNGVVRMPLLNTAWGFEPWYLDQLDPETREQAISLIALQTKHIESLTVLSHNATQVEKQYYTALGYRVPCVVTMALPALLYFMELRSSKTVHPTLRQRVLKLARWFRVACPSIALHADFDPDDWTVRRGEQTITERA